MQNFDILINGSKQVYQKSVIGGVITIISILAMILLVFYEKGNYQGLKIEKTFFMSTAPMNDKVKLKFKIKLFNAPCQILTIFMRDDVNHLQEINPTKTRIIGNEKKLPVQSEKLKPIEQAIQDIDSDVGCLLESDINIYQIGGFIKISVLPKIFIDLLQKDKFLNLSYEIIQLEIGSQNQLKDPEELKLIREMNLEQELLSNFEKKIVSKSKHLTASH